MREEKIRPVAEKPGGLSFWPCAALLVILLATSMSRDIFRPFYGLHSWAESHASWAARVHVKYGLGYTKGFSVRAVGDAIPEKPYRYLDHPMAEALISAGFMKILGVNEWSLRVINIIATSITLIFLMLVVRGLCDDKTALLSGLLFCLFPLTAYFGVHQWLYPMATGAIYCYFVLIGEIKPYFRQNRIYFISLVFCLVMAIQLSWEGYFFAIGIGVHYLWQSFCKKKKPEPGLLSTLILAPNISLLIVFTTLAAGSNWDFKRIYELFTWRAGPGEMREHIWSAWFDKLGEFMRLDFTLPVLIIAILYLTVGQLHIFAQTEPERNKNGRRARQFPHLLLFLFVPVFQLFILKGCLWAHQTWLRPFSLLIAIAAAQGILLAGDIVKKIKPAVSGIVISLLLVVVLGATIGGTNYFYNVRWQPEAKINLFKKLNSMIPADKKLLSFEDFIVNQHEAKGAFYRPEVAWYLDRDIDSAQTLEQIQQVAKTGQYPYYLLPLSFYNQQATAYVQQLAGQLQALYKYEHVPGVEGQQTKDGKFLRAHMFDYLIFNLGAKAR